jgi:hypothetical protein
VLVDALLVLDLVAVSRPDAKMELYERDEDVLGVSSTVQIAIWGGGWRVELALALAMRLNKSSLMPRALHSPRRPCAHHGMQNARQQRPSTSFPYRRPPQVTLSQHLTLWQVLTQRLSIVSKLTVPAVW